MSDKTFSYPHIRPFLAIERNGGGSLGNCYSSSSWRVTSVVRLKAETLKALNACGVLGFGQEFYIRSKADGTEEPAGHDTLPCVVTDRRTGKRLDERPVNPYARDGAEYQPIQSPFYVYDCESRCDSGD